MFTTGLKKTEPVMENSPELLELDELYWFINQEEHSKTHENVYIITMVRRNPRQIVGFDVGFDNTSKRIQKVIDSGPEAEKYCTDGYHGYLDVVFPGEHIRNIRNKKDTFTVEGINADLRHFIPLLRRRSRCFPRSIETLTAVIDVFVEAYNRFGLAKLKYLQANPHRTTPFGLVEFLFAR
jgi:IS1 family transposase